MHLSQLGLKPCFIHTLKNTHFSDWISRNIISNPIKKYKEPFLSKTYKLASTAKAFASKFLDEKQLH